MRREARSCFASLTRPYLSFLAAPRYDFEEQNSAIGNAFQQQTSESYAAVFPVSVVPGNHESCGGCPAVPGIENSRGNFSESVKRSVRARRAEGRASGSLQ